MYAGGLEGVFVDNLPLVPILHPVLLSLEVYRGKKDTRKEHS